MDGQPQNTSPATEARLVDRFRDAMSELPSGLAAVTAADRDGRPHGMLISSITSYSASPPSLMAAIARASRTHDAVTTCERFGVHVLSTDQEDLAHRFATPGEEKFDGVAWDWDDEVPRLLDALIYIPCRRRATFAHGDHAIVVGEALVVTRAEGEPLIYLRRRMDWQAGECAGEPQMIAPEDRTA